MYSTSLKIPRQSWGKEDRADQWGEEGRGLFCRDSDVVLANGVWKASLPETSAVKTCCQASHRIGEGSSSVPGRFSLETNTVSLVMKEKLNPFSLQVSVFSMFSRVSPFATVNARCVRSERSPGRSRCVSARLQKAGGSGSAGRQLGMSRSSPFSSVVQSHVAGSCLMLLPHLCMGSLGPIRRGGCISPHGWAVLGRGVNPSRASSDREVLTPPATDWTFGQ